MQVINNDNKAIRHLFDKQKENCIPSNSGWGVGVG